MSAAEPPAAGEYRIPATLTCYVDAMGGQEFGDGRIKDAVVRINADGSGTAGSANPELPAPYNIRQSLRWIGHRWK